MWGYYIITSNSHICCTLFSESREIQHSISGSSYTITKGKQHNIKNILRHPQYNPKLFPHDLALLVIFPPINLENSNNQGLLLYGRPIPPNSYCTVSGWGCNHIDKE